MNIQMNIYHNEPLQSSNGFLIPVQFEEKNPSLSLKQQQSSNKPQIIQQTLKKTKQCRICLQSDQQDSQLLKACRCVGSIQYAHVKCLIEWIKRIIQRNSDLKAKCEICDTEFNYRLATQRLFDCRQLKHHYRKQKRSLICFVVVQAILLLFFIAMIVLTVIGKDDQNIFLHGLLSSSGGTTLMISCMVVYLIVLIVVTVLFVSEYMVKQQLLIIDVQKYKQPKVLLKNYKIHIRR